MCVLRPLIFDLILGKEILGKMFIRRGMPITSAFRRLRQEDHQAFGARLVYKVRPCPKKNSNKTVGCKCFLK